MQLFHNECCIREEKMSKDLRNIKTKENIESHFINLLERYKFQDITIKLLINECQINRSTFYRNYEDKYDLIYKIVEELIKQFKKNIHCQFITLHLKKENDFKPYFSSLLDYFNKHKDIFIVLYNNDLPINIFDEMLTIYSHYLLNELIYHYHISDSQIKIANYFSKIIAYSAEYREWKRSPARGLRPSGCGRSSSRRCTACKRSCRSSPCRSARRG